MPWSRLRRDQDDNVIGVLPQAYQRREDEESISVNWLERTPGSRKAQLIQAVVMIRNTQPSGRVGAKARLAVSEVQTFKTVCRNQGSKVRIVHDPIDGNEPHSEVRQIPRDDQMLLDAIVKEAVEGHYPIGDLV
ncbi:MAG: hypothetical protein ABIO68_02185 [Sphingomicrobium sp.]